MCRVRRYVAGCWRAANHVRESEIELTKKYADAFFQVAVEAPDFPKAMLQFLTTQSNQNTRVMKVAIVLKTRVS